MTTQQTLHIFVIHADHLTHRAAMVHGNIQTIRTTAIKMGYNVQVKLITKHNPSELEKSLEELQKQINYEQTEDPYFNTQFQILSLEVISNMKKHHAAWQRIIELSPNDLFMVIEDDIFNIPNTMPHFEKLLQNYQTEIKPSYDILFMGIADSVQDTAIVKPIQNLGVKAIPAKDSYFITYETAKKLLQEWGPMKFSFRIHLSYLIKRMSLKVGYSCRPIFLDGSKLGLVPTTINTGNMLVFNREFMDMYQFLQKSPEEIIFNLAKITQIYGSIQHMESGDISFMFGMILAKAKKYKEAEILFKKAAEEIKKKQGLLNNRSDITNQTIEIYKHLQDDLPELLNHPSKYADHSMSLSDI